MKFSSKIFGIVIAVMLCFALCLAVTSCKKSEPIEGVTLENASFVYDGSAHSLAVSGNVPEGVEVSYEGNGVTNVGEYTVTATLSGEDYETLTLTATITVTKADITGVTLPDATVTYDGTEKSLAVSGNVPEGVEVSYTGNGAIAAGQHEISATLTGANYNDLTLDATLTIEKGTYDMSGIALNNKQVTYDGNAQSIELAGTLPEGLTVSYEGNGVTDVGEYTVTATFTNTNPNYNNVEPMTATLTIVKSDIAGISLSDVTVTYDGQPHSALISGTLPEGVDVSYSVQDVVNAGTYEVVATFTVTSGNYNELPALTATITINKASLADVVTLNDLTVAHTAGDVHTLTVTGDVPADVDVAYTNNVQTTPGTYTVTATLTGDNYETLVLTATLTVKGGEGSGLLTPEDSFDD